jgi:predicted protein tyrosine phosphatase
MQLKIMSLAEAKSTDEKFTHLISVIEPKYHPILPDLGIPPERRLLLVCDDTNDPEPDHFNPRPPTKMLVAEGLAFAQKLPESASLLVHCFAGVSRSVALSYAILCQANPKKNEQSVLRKVLMLRRSAIPNSLIVAYADELLDRYGHMSEAVLDYQMNRAAYLRTMPGPNDD